MNSDSSRKFRPSLVVLCAIAAAVLAGVYVKKQRAAPRGEPGFLEYVKHPELAQAADEQRKQTQAAVAEAQKWGDDEAEKKIDAFVFAGNETSSGALPEDKEILSSLGPRLTAVALKILNEPALRARLTKPTVTEPMAEAPLNRLCELFGDTTPDELVAPLAPFLDDPSEGIRKDVAFTMAKAGTKAIIEPLRKALADQSESVRTAALEGLQYPVERGSLDAACKSELFADVQRVIASQRVDEEAAALLLKFDQERAAKYFQSAEALKPANESLAGILKALSKTKALIPRPALLDLIHALQAAKADDSKAAKAAKAGDPAGDRLGAALEHLGYWKNPEDEGLLERLTKDPRKDVAVGAAEGLLAFHGLEDYEEKIATREAKLGFEKLSAPEQYVTAVWDLDGEVNNGGHTQYFSNPSGDEWRLASAGLEAMGCKKRAAILHDAMSKFGPNGPSEEQDARAGQLAKLINKNEKVFDADDDRYFQCDEIVGVYIANYVIKNAQSFP